MFTPVSQSKARTPRLDPPLTKRANLVRVFAMFIWVVVTVFANLTFPPWVAWKLKSGASIVKH